MIPQVLQHEDVWKKRGKEQVSHGHLETCSVSVGLGQVKVR